MIDILGFLKKNNQKKLTVEIWLWAAVYRFAIRFLAMNKLQKFFGERGQESEEQASPEEYKYAKRIALQVNRSANHTPWESRCLVRALTAQKMLKKKNIHSTMYLGVKTEEEKMVAHAWLRVGKLYVTGGNGEGYAMVDKYRV